MASKALLVIFAMTLIAVAFTAQLEEDLSEDLTVEDFQDYFQAMQMEKRGSKVGSKFIKIIWIFFIIKFIYELSLVDM